MFLNPKLLLIYFFVLSGATANSQKADSLTKKSIHYTVAKGISSDIVSDIKQDQRGLIWIATEDGLNRFDGSNFKYYKHDSKNAGSIGSNNVRKVFFDKNNNLWVGSSAGLQRFDYSKDSFLDFKVSDSPSQPMISGFSLSKDKRIWVGLNGSGFSLLNPTNAVYVNYNKTKLKGLRSDFVSSIYDDQSGLIWVGTWDNGLHVFKTSNGQITTKLNLFEPLLISTTARAFYNDSNNNLWIACNDYLLFYKRSTKQIYKVDAKQIGGVSQNFTALHEGGKVLYIASADGSVYNLNLTTTSISHPSSFIFKEIKNKQGGSITSSIVLSLYSDRDKNLWIGTLGDGLFIHSSATEKFIKFEKIRNDKAGSHPVAFLAFCEDQKQNFWLGTDKDGLYRTNNKGETIEHYFNNKGFTATSVASALCDSYGRIWFGTFGEGLFLYNAEKNTFTCYKNTSDPLNTRLLNDIRTIAEDNNKRLLLGTQGGGLVVFDPQRRAFRSYNLTNSKIGSNVPNDIVCDRLGNIWVASEGAGLKVMEPWGKEFKSIQLSDSPQETFNIISLKLDLSGSLWIGTLNDGLFIYNPKTKLVRRFQESDGLISNAISAIEVERGGVGWVSTNRGISRIDIKNNRITSFNRTDGLQAGLFYGNASIYNEKNGYMCFGGLGGWNMFYPHNFANASLENDLIISDIQFLGLGADLQKNNERVEISFRKTNKLSVPYNLSSFTIQYSKLDFTNPGNTNYSYKLEGIDNNWNYVDKKTSVTFGSLPPGTYTFIVKASSPGNISTGNYASLLITILPPWYRTWWAYSLYALLGALLFYTYIYYRSYQQKLRYELRLAQMQVENEKEIQEKQNSFFTYVTHEFRSPLVLIANPIKEWVTNGIDQHNRDNLYGVYRNARRLLSLVDQLLLFKKAEAEEDRLLISKVNFIEFCREIALCFKHQAKSKEIIYEFETDSTSAELYIDKEKMEIVFFNLLSNAFKYTPKGGLITVSVSADAEMVKFAVADSGSGIPDYVGDLLFEKFYKVKEQKNVVGFGIGLFLVKRFTELHGGKVSYTNRPEGGTIFEVRLKQGKEHLRGELVSEVNNNKPAFILELLEEPSDEAIFHEIHSPKHVKNLSGKAFAERSVAEIELTGQEHILIVEDDDEIRTYLIELLKPLYQVHSASDGKQGLEIVNEVHPDLIISDVMMPEMDGMEFCRLIRNNVETSHIPLILLTARDAMDSKIEGVISGADIYMSKPFNAKLLLTTIKNLFEQHQKLKNHYSKNYYAEIKELVHTSKDREFMDKLMNIVDENLMEFDLDVDFVARQIGMSKSNLYLKLKKITGQSIVEFLRSYRMKKAIQIMTEEDVALGDVVYRVGIQSQSYFTRAFKKEYGKTPSQFIQEIKTSKPLKG